MDDLFKKINVDLKQGQQATLAGAMQSLSSTSYINMRLLGIILEKVIKLELHMKDGSIDNDKVQKEVSKAWGEANKLAEKDFYEMLAKHYPK